MDLRLFVDLRVTGPGSQSANAASGHCVPTLGIHVIYVENTDTAQYLNFDFLMENQTKETLVLESITLSVFDERDSLVRREFVNEYSRRSLDLVGPLRLAPRDTALIFDPFHTFASGISLTKLTYEFAFV